MLYCGTLNKIDFAKKLVVLQWCSFFIYLFFIMYKRCLPKGVLRFQHNIHIIVSYLLANRIKMVL